MITASTSVTRAWVTILTAGALLGAALGVAIEYIRPKERP